jgi:hypothetical protein
VTIKFTSGNLCVANQFLLFFNFFSEKQRAMVALEALPIYKAEARERQRGGQDGILLPVILPEAKGDARDQVAQDFDTSEKYLSDAKKIKEEHPEKAEPATNNQLLFKKALSNTIFRILFSGAPDGMKTLRIKFKPIFSCFFYLLFAFEMRYLQH